VLARAIKAEPSIARTVLVLLTSGLDRDSDQLRAAGIVAHMHKPDTREQLHDCLVRLVGRGTKAAAANGPGRPADDAAGPETISQPILESRGSVLIVEDNPVNQRVAQAMITKLGYRVQVAGNGRLALDLL